MLSLAGEEVSEEKKLCCQSATMKCRFQKGAASQNARNANMIFLTVANQMVMAKPNPNARSFLRPLRIVSQNIPIAVQLERSVLSPDSIQSSLVRRNAQVVAKQIRRNGWHSYLWIT